MIVIGILLSFAAAASLCWLVFELAVYALPASVGVAAGSAAWHTGAGTICAVIVGFLVAVGLLFIGQLTFGVARSRFTSAVVGLAFATPAAVAGYAAIHGLASFSAASPGWQQAFAALGAILVGGTAWARLSVVPLRPAEPDRDRAGQSSTARKMAADR